VFGILLVVLLILGILAGGLWFLIRDGFTASTEGDSQSLSIDNLQQIGIGIYLQFQQDEITQPVSDDPAEVDFVIQPGETPATIATRLENRNLIRDERLFRLLVRYLGVDDQLEAGTYGLRRDMTMEEIVAQLQHGQIKSIQVTIPEGWRMEQIAQLLARENVVDEGVFLDLAQKGEFQYAFLQNRPVDSPRSLEGFLFPDTYQFDQSGTTRSVIIRLLDTFDRRISPEMRQRADEMDMLLYQVVTLASIVEREAVVAEERPIIASVYLNRLQRGMYLQSDPTVQYAKGFSKDSGRWWNPMIQEEAQTVDSPYNTFLYPGLPPGPICSPGLASIEAVLYAADTPYLFFYAKGDGSHAFAETYEEHLENQAKYSQ
jgi:UPF0755 protein